MFSLLTLLAVAPIMVQGVTTKQGDLEKVVFTLPEGKVTVLLPHDMTAGDTITGTVVLEPAAGPGFSSNEATLKGIVVDVGDSRPRMRGSQATWVIPAGLAAVGVTLIGTGGGPRGTASCGLMPGDVLNSPPGFSCDPVSRAGSPLSVRGPFDGDAANTTASVGGAPVIPIAESPRTAVFGSVPNTPGATQIGVNESGVSATLPCNLILVQLSAAKTSLIRGERIPVRMTISGLTGLPPSNYPLPYEIVNESPGIVQLQGAAGNVLCGGLPSSAVSNGVGIVNANLVGIQPGAYLLRGIFFAVNVHDAKKVMNAEAFNAWVKGLIQGYEAKLKKLREDLANDPKNGGLKLNIQRKEKILGILQALGNVGNAELDACKAIVDKSLADDSFFTVAAELISAAADLLGYTDIPMPGVGAIVKGAKALAGAAKLAKAVDLLAKAEKLIEEYDKLKDAADKAKKALEIKETLDKAKEEMK